ncbi:MAG: CPBP family intramembrane metalloprotease [Planctomycetes bacterium]|nr:CPBP family intramembrane metalloprotease [Planctomycetota bacterium]
MNEITTDDKSSRSLAQGAWRSMLAAVRAVLLGFVMLIVGGSVSGALMFANLKLAPTLPLFFPATVLWLWLFWRYVRGDGWPRSTSARRRDLLRVRMLSLRAWGWALVAGGLALAAVMGIAFMTYRLAALPDAAYRAPFEVASFPLWTLVSIFAAVALTAAVVEEAAFRGYMLSGIQRGHGWLVGIGLVTVLFYVAHLSHAYATLAFVPFFLAHGLTLGLLVFYTRSIVPGIILHAVSDFIVLPMQYGVIPSAGQWTFVWQGWLSLLAGAAAIPAFRQLARATVLERIDTAPR